MRVEQKVHERGFLCEGPGVCHDHAWLKFFLKWRKIACLLAKDLAKVYVYVICIYSLDQCSKECLPGRKAMATPNP